MSSITVLELGQCIFWGAFGISPLVLFLIESGDDGADFGLKVFGLVLQIAFSIAIFKAGGK